MEFSAEEAPTRIDLPPGRVVRRLEGEPAPGRRGSSYPSEGAVVDQVVASLSRDARFEVVDNSTGD